MRDLADKLAPSLEAIETRSQDLIAIGERWRQARSDARTLVADASQTLESFVSSAQEAGKQDSQRSANVSIIFAPSG